MSLEEPLGTERPAPEQSSVSLAEAYEEHHDGITEKAAPEPKKDQETWSLDDVSEYHRAKGELDHELDSSRRERARQLRSERNSLADAHDGVSHEADIEQQLEAEAAEAAAAEQETEEFLEEQRRLADEEAEESEQEQEEGELKEGEEQEEQKEEPAKEPIPMPASLEELLQPGNEKALEAFNAQNQEVWQRSQATSAPVMVDFVVNELARTMETPIEAIPALRDAVQVLNFGAQNFIESTVPKMVEQHLVSFAQNHFQQVLEAYIPEIAEMRQSYAENLAAKTWADTIASEEFASLKLPAFATDEFNALAEKVYQQNPWLATLDPVDADGKQLPLREALRAKAQVAARLCAGDRVNAKEILRQVVEASKTAKRNAESNQRRVSASKMLGRGRSTGSIGSTESHYGLSDAWNERHGKGGF
jgi:hypothetical protein